VEESATARATRLLGIRESRNARLVRRERFAGAVSVVYGTTVGHAWVFGYESTRVPVGAFWITQDRHHVEVPQPKPSREKQLARRGFSALVTRFTVHPTIGEFMREFISPTDLMDTLGVPRLREFRPGER
jgi:hypothetical protein